MKSILLLIIYISNFFYNECGCIRRCCKYKNKNEKSIEDEGVFNDTINIKQEKIEKTTLKIKEDFNEKEKEIFKEIADKNLKLDKNENLNNIDEGKFKNFKKILEYKEETKTITEEQKQLLDKLNKIDKKNIEKEKEIISIPFIENDENLSFVTKEQIITTIESAYDKSIKEEDKILKKNIIEAINVLDNEIKNDNAKEQKQSLKFDSESDKELYIFGIKIYDGNQVDYIYNKLFDFNNGENCYQIEMIKKDKNGSVNSDIKYQNLTGTEKIFNFTFKKKTTKKLNKYVSILSDKFEIETTHNVNNDFYLKNKDDDSFMLYVDSDAIFAEDPKALFLGRFNSSSGGINVYTDILYYCFYDKKAKCTFFFTINFARYKLGTAASFFNGTLKAFPGKGKPKNDIEKKRLEILQNQGIYILEIKEQNDENVKEIYNELNADTTLTNAFNSIKEKINNSKE